MKEHIQEQLRLLESELDIKILYAVESGSRAWGFASTDSDWDVRFVYVHKMDWYLSIDEKKDSIERMLPNDLDLSGWELRKTLKLFRKSNPPLLEWLTSPIVYHEEPIVEELRSLSKEFFNPRACMYHYFHMADGNFREYLQRDLVRVKKYFYVIRPLLACAWLEEFQTAPPVEFDRLVETQLKGSAVKNELNALLERKMSGEELATEPKNVALNDYIEDRMSYYRDLLASFPVNKPDGTEKLDAYFRNVLSKYSA